MKDIAAAALRKSIVAVETERSKYLPHARPDRAQAAALTKGRRASDKLVAAFLAKGGLDMKAFAALQQQRDAELERIAGEHKAASLRRASQQKDTLHSSIVGQSKAWRALAAKPDFFPYPTFTLDTPFLIWTTPLADIADSAAAPFASFAKFKFATSKYQGPQKLGFYFYWANPFNDYAVINAATFMSATGHMKSHAPWTVGVNTSWVEAWARFGLWFGFPGNVSSTDYASQFLGSIGAFGSTFTGGETRSTSVSGAASLNKTMFAVPPSAVVVFEVALALEYENNDGNIEADFASGDFRIACPVVVFSLLNSPPGAMA